MGMLIEVDENGVLTRESTQFLQQRNRLTRFCAVNGVKYNDEDLVQPTALRGPYATTQHNSGALPPDTAPAEVELLESDEAEAEEEDVEAEESSDEDELVEDNYDDEEAWSFTALKQELRSRDLPQNGNRGALIERLRANDAEQATGE